jgi:hypothetical protein
VSGFVQDGFNTTTNVFLLAGLKCGNIMKLMSLHHLEHTLICNTDANALNACVYLVRFIQYNSLYLEVLDTSLKIV